MNDGISEAESLQSLPVTDGGPFSPLSLATRGRHYQSHASHSSLVHSVPFASLLHTSMPLAPYASRSVRFLTSTSLTSLITLRSLP